MSFVNYIACSNQKKFQVLEATKKHKDKVIFEFTRSYNLDGGKYHTCDSWLDLFKIN